MSAPMEIGMAAKEDGENATQEGDQRIIDLPLQAVYKGIGKGKCAFGKGQNWSEKGCKGGKDGGKDSWQKGSGKKGGKGQEKGGKGKTRTCWTCGKTLQLGAGKVETKTCTPKTKMTVGTSWSHLKEKRICKHGVYWKRAKMSSGRR